MIVAGAALGVTERTHTEASTPAFGGRLRYRSLRCEAMKHGSQANPGQPHQCWRGQGWRMATLNREHVRWKGEGRMTRTWQGSIRTLPAATLTPLLAAEEASLLREELPGLPPSWPLQGWDHILISDILASKLTKPPPCGPRCVWGEALRSRGDDEGLRRDHQGGYLGVPAKPSIQVQARTMLDAAIALHDEG